LCRNCLLQQVIEGKIKGGIKVTGRRGRRRRKLLDNLKERTGYSHLKEEALDRTVWRAGFGRGFGPLVRQTIKYIMPHAQQVIEGNIQGGIEVIGRRGRRRRKLLDDLKERRGYSNLKEEALDRTVWRAGIRRGFGSVVRQAIKYRCYVR
jgi:hypothetical protein